MTIAQLIKRKHSLIEAEKEKEKKAMFDAEEMEKRLLQLRRQEQEKQIWANIDQMEGLSEIQRVEIYNQELMKITEMEAVVDEDKRQQAIAYIVKYSKTKKSSIQNLSFKQLEQRIKLLKDKQRIQKENFRRNQVVQELVDAGYV